MLEIRRLLKSISNELNLPFISKLPIGTFMEEVYLMPRRVSGMGRMNCAIDGETIGIIEYLNLLGWVYFRVKDDFMDDGYRKESDMILIEKFYIAMLNRFGISMSRIFEESILKPGTVSERDIISRNAVYYLIFDEFCRLPNQLKSSFDSYLLARQYVDDLKDYFHDIGKDRETLLTSHYRCHPMEQIEEYYVRTIVTSTIRRVMELLKSGYEQLHKYQPYKNLLKNVYLTRVLLDILIPHAKV